MRDKNRRGGDGMAWEKPIELGAMNHRSAGVCADEAAGSVRQ